MCELAEKREEIQRLWLREMVRQDGMKRYIIVVDHTGEQAEVFQAIAQAAAPHFGKLPVDMIPYGTGFADAATEDAMPFYVRGRIKKDRKCGPENVTGRASSRMVS